MRFLFAILFALLIGVGPTSAQVPGFANPYTQRLNPFQFFTSGSYIGFVSPFNVGAILLGAGGYQFSNLIVKLQFPNGSLISWSFASNSPCPPPTGLQICGFGQESYGAYDGTDGPAVPVTAKQVKNISSFFCVDEFTRSGTDDGWDGIYDQFLTSVANGNASTQVDEIEIFLHSNSTSIAYVQSVTQIGTYTDANAVSWTVAVDTTGAIPDILAMPSSEADFNGDFDIKAFFAYLSTKSRLTGNEWANGIAIGPEPLHDAATMALAEFQCHLN